MRILFFYLISLSINYSNAQSYYDIAAAKTNQLSFEPPSIIGLWLVVEVKVGTESMTPVAKWFDFQKGGKLFGGNGGITNIRGAWAFDQNQNLLEQQSGSQKDPYGPFSVEFIENQMIWQRYEDGQLVKVSLSQITVKPLAPWDKIQGNWSVVEIQTESKNESAVDNNLIGFQKIYFGWDGRYRKYDSAEKRIGTGIWHIEAHSPWLWTISDAENTKTGWSISFSEGEMIWKHENDNLLIKILFEKGN